MKSGLTIVEMAQQIERQSKLKQDYLLDTRRLQVEPFGSQLYLHTFDDHDDPLVEPLEINQIAHRQIGTHLKIPAAYYDRMLSDYPELLAENVNSWFQREPTQRMVRTLDGTVRAFLSNRYRRIDNLDIAEIVLPVIQQMEDAYFESCQITDSRMYIKVVNKRLEAEVVPGDIVQSGVIISNSEVGLGSVNIQPLVYRLVYCSSSYPKTAAGSHVWFSPACLPQDSLLSGLANLPFGFPFPVPTLSTRQRVCHRPHLTHWERCGYNTHPDNG